MVEGVRILRKSFSQKDIKAGSDDIIPTSPPQEQKTRNSPKGFSTSP